MPIYHQGEAYDLDHDVYSGAEAVHQARRWVRMPIDYWRWWQRGAIDAAQTLSISTSDGFPQSGNLFNFVKCWSKFFHLLQPLTFLATNCLNFFETFFLLFKCRISNL